MKSPKNGIGHSKHQSAQNYTYDSPLTSSFPLSRDWYTNSVKFEALYSILFIGGTNSGERVLRIYINLVILSESGTLDTKIHTKALFVQ